MKIREFLKKLLEGEDDYWKKDKGVNISKKIYLFPLSDMDEKELTRKSPEIRFIVDGINKKVYIFDQNIMHVRAAAELKLPYTMNTPASVKPVIYGIGTYRNGKIEYGESFSLEAMLGVSKQAKDWKKALDTLFKTDFSFADPYIVGLPKTAKEINPPERTFRD